MNEYFDDCQIGDSVVTAGRTITEADVVMFAMFSGDWNAAHTDADFAGKTPFGERIAHGMLTVVVATGLLVQVQELIPNSLIAATSLDRVRWIKPVKFGDTIRVEGEIIQLQPMGPERGLVGLRFRVKNQHDEVITTGRFKVQAGRRPTDSAKA